MGDAMVTHFLVQPVDSVEMTHRPVNHRVYAEKRGEKETYIYPLYKRVGCPVRHLNTIKGLHGFLRHSCVTSASPASRTIVVLLQRMGRPVTPLHQNGAGPVRQNACGRAKRGAFPASGLKHA